MTASLYGDPWVYVFVTSERPVRESDVQLNEQTDVAMAWADLYEEQTHFRYWKRGMLKVSLDASGIENSGPVRVRSFTGTMYGKYPFRCNNNLGEVLQTITARLGIKINVQPPLRAVDGGFKLEGDPAEYQSITLTELNPLESGECPASDRLLAAINERCLPNALRALSDGASSLHSPGSRTTPLELAAFAGEAELVKALVKAGCPLDRNSSLIADSVLHFNPEAKVLNIVETLAALGASINAPGPSGLTPLHYAVHAKFPSVVRRLIELGADVTARDSLLGTTPLERAALLTECPEKNSIISLLSVAVRGRNASK
jgi:hypothetical protein